MQPPTTSPGAAGWHPDPTGRYEFRYHNGQRWTSDVAQDGERYVDPLGAPHAGDGTVRSAPPPTGAPATAAVPLPPGTVVAPPGRGRAILAFLLALGAVLLAWTPFLFVVGAGLAIAALVLGIQVLRRSSAPTGAPGGPVRGFGITAVVLAPIALGLCVVGVVLTGVTWREFDEYADPGPLDVEITSCTLDGGLATAIGTVRNLDDRTRSYIVIVDFADGRDDVESERAEVRDVAAGGSAEWTVRSFTGDVELGCEIRDVTGPYPFDLETGT